MINCANEKFTEAIAAHAFVRDPSKLSDETMRKCASVVVGDATHPDDIHHALVRTKASIVIMAIGAGDNTAKTDIRESSAKVLMNVIGPGTEHENVRVVVMSSHGAGGSRIKAGFGVGSLIELYIRHVLADHDQQEAVFKAGMADKTDSRLLIVRPTSLSVDKAKGLERVVEFGNLEKAPSIHIDRADVAEWVLTRLWSGNGKFGGEFNLTCV